MVFLGDVHGFSPGGGVRRIRRDTVNERAVRILLECILVFKGRSDFFRFTQTISVG